MSSMSAELRVKKLRGSGGYVMASVSDDQQRKGNLGGPDLFLAPIGRLEVDRITKYFCNTCERDYEGSPRIEYENPNETVAENLMLVEKGQYLCSTCGSALAEYREFRKPDEAQSVGNAKPIEDTFESFSSKTTQVSQPQSVQPPPSMQPPKMDSDFTYATQVEPPKQTSYTEGTSQISSIVGMAVYDENAKKVGTAKQIGIDSSQSLVLVIAKNDGSESNIPWNFIKKVGEIILVGSSTQAQPQSIPSSVSPKIESGRCSNCGFDNKAGSKFCEDCGTKL